MAHMCQPLARRLLVLWPVFASGTPSVVSLHSSFVVNLDFEGQARAAASAEPAEARAPSDNASKVIVFAGGQQKFRCQLPFLRNRTTGSFSGERKDHARLEKYFRAAKVSPLKGKCYTFRKDYWHYDLCVGRNVTQYNEDHTLRYLLGRHVAEKERLHADGSITQVYTGGTDNRTTIVEFICGPGSSQTLSTAEITETEPLLYSVQVGAPMFCAWREQNGTQTTMADGSVVQVGSLLEGLRSRCIDVTHGWWTYEYCFPHTLRQYHLQGSKKDPIHTLGTLNGTTADTEPNKVNVSLERLKSSVVASRERKGVPSNHKALTQFLGNGAVCDETGKARQVLVSFQCPPDWQQDRVAKFVSIGESTLCEYEVLIHTDLVCGHQRMLPALSRGQDVIQCSVEADGSLSLQP